VQAEADHTRTTTGGACHRPSRCVTGVSVAAGVLQRPGRARLRPGAAFWGLSSLSGVWTLEPQRLRRLGA